MATVITLKFMTIVKKVHTPRRIKLTSHTSFCVRQDRRGRYQYFFYTNRSSRCHYVSDFFDNVLDAMYDVFVRHELIEKMPPGQRFPSERRRQQNNGEADETPD